ncbi:GNAT family N-acetyltransferase [Brevibacillus reuszeri]|uniref:GNAT family N-acetyltransferase n=1 Tax=Brevibacillus reuszeri TaxID=54915 RepID=UPI0028A1CF22|nr:GNAT family N-acetyltransferase [Brevibacillus reuszeri]
MLDKSIPYYNVIMRLRSGIAASSFSLPSGYTYAWFEPGNEKKWAEIETSVGEFTTVEQAHRYFCEHYLRYVDEVKRRVLFILNPDGEEVGTITSWWNVTGERRDPSIHWFAVKKEYQGIGLGKALVSKGLRQLKQLEGDGDIYLHTQTWSYKAIELYIQAGFEILENESFGGYQNDYEKAMPFIEMKLRKG